MKRHADALLFVSVLAAAMVVAHNLSPPDALASRAASARISTAELARHGITATLVDPSTVTRSQIISASRAKAAAVASEPHTVVLGAVLAQAEGFGISPSGRLVWIVSLDPPGGGQPEECFAISGATCPSVPVRTNVDVVLLDAHTGTLVGGVEYVDTSFPPFPVAAP